MNGSAESSAQDRDAFSGVKIRFSPAGIAARRGARAPTRGCGGARSRDDRGDKCTRPLASFRRARVPLAMESARSSPTTRDGALASGTSAFQMGTGTPEARQQFVPRRSFAAHAPRSAPIFRDFAVIVILWQDRSALEGCVGTVLRARRCEPRRHASPHRQALFVPPRGVRVSPQVSLCGRLS